MWRSIKQRGRGEAVKSPDTVLDYLNPDRFLLTLTMFSSLSDALKQTGFSDAMAKLGLSSGPGSDGTLPSGSRQLRSDSLGCTKLLANWIAFNNSADLGVPGKVLEAVLTQIRVICRKWWRIG